MMKKYCCTALLFECAAWVGAYLVQLFTARKMGMLRWVNHLCNGLSRELDLDRLCLILMAAAALAALALVLASRKRMRSLWPLTAAAVSGVGVFIVYTLCNTRRTMAAYYLVCFLLLLGAAAALLCWAVALLKSGRK